MFEQEGVVEGQEPEVEGSELTQEPAAQPQEETSIPYQRFEKVYGRMKELEAQVARFKDFGDADAVRSQIDKLKQWEKAVEDARKQAAQTPDDKAEAQRAAQIRKELEKVYPEIADVKSLKELREELNAMKAARAEEAASVVLKDMSSKFTETLKAAKIDTKYQSKIEDYIVSQMSQEERQDFVKGNYEVAKQIFDNELKDGLFASMKAKPVVPTPALRNTPGGTPPSGKVTKAKSLEEAANEAFSMLKG